MCVKLVILGLAGVALLIWPGTTAPSSPLRGVLQVAASGRGKAASSATTRPGGYAVAAASVSSNWSGYVDSSGPYAGVFGSWTVPSLTGQQGGVVAEWVGIGGTGRNPDLLQAGVIEQWSGGQPVATAFTESLPASAQLGQTVAIGAPVTASVTPSGANEWTLSVRSGSTVLASQTVTLSQDDAQMAEQSAEWITEAPSTGGGRVEPLASFSPVTFQAATVETAGGRTEGLAAAGTPAPFVLASLDGLEAQPGAIGSDGESFTVTESVGQPQSLGVYPYGRHAYRGWGGGFGAFGGYDGYGGYGGDQGYGGYGYRSAWGW